jgi:hypothetical protein
MNAISFSLWGNDPMYCVGAIRNAELIGKIYPGWMMVVYADRTVPSEVTEKLAKIGVTLRKPPCSNGMFWRFFIADDPKVERFLVRDADSRLNIREAGAVKEWIESGKAVHIIADHPGHTPPIGGGLWGAVRGAVPNMSKLIEACEYSKMESKRETVYNTDQRFLGDVIWPLVKNNCLIHDLCYHRTRRGARPFPAKFSDERFVGEVFDANDKPRAFDASMRLNWMQGDMV